MSGARNALVQTTVPGAPVGRASQSSPGPQRKYDPSTLIDRLEPSSHDTEHADVSVLGHRLNSEFTLWGTDMVTGNVVSRVSASCHLCRWACIANEAEFDPIDGTCVEHHGYAHATKFRGFAAATTLCTGFTSNMVQAYTWERKIGFPELDRVAGDQRNLGAIHHEHKGPSASESFPLHKSSQP